MRRAETLGAALDGVDRALLISSADPHMVETQCTFIDAARRAGVRHIVKFSGRSARPDASFRFLRMHAEIEAYLERSGVAWTHLRPGQFMQVYFREVPTIVAEDALYLPMAQAAIAPVDIEDIARVAGALLLGGGHDGERLEMTGPEALTMSEVAERISEAVGRQIRYVDIAPADKHAALLRAGVPADFVDALDELFEMRRAGAESEVHLETHHAFGVRPTSFAEFARRTAAVFRGEAPGSARLPGSTSFAPSPPNAQTRPL
jgi:uncharacterized protein YbjT (DUF2867 family)